MITRFRVRYGECDPSGVAHHSSYFLWFEQGRADLLRARGVDYSAMEISKLYLPIVDASCRYIVGVKYDDELELLTSITELRSRTVRFESRLYRGSIQVAQGTTYHCLMNGEGKAQKWPENLVGCFRPDGALPSLEADT